MAWTNTSHSPNSAGEHEDVLANVQLPPHGQQNVVPGQFAITQYASPYSEQAHTLGSSRPQDMQTGEVQGGNETVHQTSLGQSVREPANLPFSGVQTGADHRGSGSLSTPWYQSNFSSINWLPEDWTPDFQGNMLGPFGHEQDLDLGDNTTLEEQRLPAGDEITDVTRSRVPPHQAQSPVQPTRTSQLEENRETLSPESSSIQSAGRFYVDGDGARLPHVRKAPYRFSQSYSHDHIQENRSAREAIGFPDLEQAMIQTLPLSHMEEMPVEIYNEVLRVFNLTCITSTNYPNYHAGTFPSMNLFAYFVRLYSQHFQPSLPFTHPATFRKSLPHWLLVLAMAAIGSQYIDFQGIDMLVIAMHEFTRRAIQTIVGTPNLRVTVG